MRVRGTVEYLGTGLAGWQVQPGQATVQGEIERALATILGAPVRVAASGRTDAGVHASGQVIAFDLPQDSELLRLRHSINALTPAGITVVELSPAGPGFDPRRHALARSYEYTIVHGRPPSPFLRDRSWTLYLELDLEPLHRLAAAVIGEHDFTAFRAADCASKSTRRVVRESVWQVEGETLTYRITANAFLKQMVRTLVGSMVDVSLGHLDETVFVDLLEGGCRTQAGRTAPAQGLSLVSVEYPRESIAEDAAASAAGPSLDSFGDE